MSYKQQEKALELLKAWVTSPKQIFVLSGYSGTGKSYLSRQFVEWYRENFSNRAIAVIAPSHKAVKNIGTILGGLVEAKTISSFLGLTPQIDQSTGVLTFTAGTDRNCSADPRDFDLVIVDEYSMINQATVIDLNNQCQKILYLGDPAQLPPIGEDESVVPKLKSVNYQLTDVVRYSGDLARVAHSWRVDTPQTAGNGVSVSLKRIGEPTPITTTPDDTIVELTKIKWISQYCESVENGENVQLLTYTNKACDKWNAFVRSEIWESSEPYIVGDKLIAKSPLFRPSSKNKLETAFNNSTEFTCSGDFNIYNMRVCGVDYRYHSVPVQTELGGRTELFILDGASKLIQSTELDRLKTEAVASKITSHRGALWARWHQLKKTFDDVTFAYAITTHKAQGSTYDAVYLDLPDISKCSDIKRITYTALTRSKQAYSYV